MYEQESKAVSFFLRHAAKIMGWDVTKDGFVNVEDLIQGVAGKKFPNFNLDILEHIVREDEKGRYSFNEDATKIRANQGHSFDVDLGLKPEIPPTCLWHGTNEGALPGIYKQGLLKMKRQHVHLTDEPGTAASVGMRKGSEVIIEINTREMVKQGIPFYRSTNGVWLVDHVPAKYLSAFVHKRKS